MLRMTIRLWQVLFTAFQNRMPFIGVTYGYGLKKEMEQAGVTLFASTTEELRALLGL